MTLWLIGVVCAREIWSPLTTFFSIVRYVVHYGMRFSVVLGFLRLCLEKQLICMLVGESVVTLRGFLWKMVSSCLLWCLQREGKIDVSRITRGHWWSLCLIFSTLYTQTTAFLASFVVSFYDSLVPFSFSSQMVFFFALQVPQQHLSHLMIFQLFIKKIKNKKTLVYAKFVLFLQLYISQPNPR